MDETTRTLWKIYAESLVKSVNRLVSLGIITEGIPHNLPITDNTGRKMMITVTVTERE